jgi:Tfp pilus assembly protein PilN
MTPLRFGRQQIGIALGAEQLTAALSGSSARVTIPCALGDTEVVETLARAFQDLRAQLSAASGLALAAVDLNVALLPPLSDARLIGLPPLRKAEAEAVIRRDAARHFVGGHVVRTIAVRTPPRTQHGAPVLAAAAASTLIEHVREAAALVGWRVRRIVPAVAAWLSALEQTPPAGLNTRVCVAQSDDALTVLRIDDAQIQLRRLPLQSLNDLPRAAGAGPGRAFIWVDPENRGACERLLAAAEWQVESAAGSGKAAAIAAHQAARSALEFIPQSLVLEWAHTQRRLAVRLGVAAALFIVAAATAELWGVQHELTLLREQRARIHKDVIPLLVARDSINTLEQRITQIRTVQTSAPRWTSALFDLSMLLPADTYLRSFHASGDTLVIEATGARAGDAIQALRSAPTFRDVRLRGQVERVLEDGATTTERFSIQARLASPDSTASVKPAPKSRRPAAGRS